MSENSSADLVHTLREQGARYVVGTEGQPVAVLLSMDEYDHYLDLLDDEAGARPGSPGTPIDENERSRRHSWCAILQRTSPVQERCICGATSP